MDSHFLMDAGCISVL